MYLINQRVIVHDEIGTVQRGPTMAKGPPRVEEPREGYVWVHLPSKGYACHCAEHNVRPLPDGQL